MCGCFSIMYQNCHECVLQRAPDLNSKGQIQVPVKDHLIAVRLCTTLGMANSHILYLDAITITANTFKFTSAETLYIPYSLRPMYVVSLTSKMQSPVYTICCG